MTASRTPRRDAVRAWLNAGCVGELVIPNDPPGWGEMNRIERLRTIVSSCSSGFPGAAGVRRVVVDKHGRQIPPPPTPRRTS